MFFKKIMFLYLVLFCCGLQSSLTNPKKKPKPPFPCSLAMSSDSIFVDSTDDLAGSSQRFASKEYAEEKSENLEIATLKRQVKELSGALVCSKKDVTILKNFLRIAFTHELELKATLNDAHRCNTSVLIGAATFISSTICVMLCLSPSCDNKIVKIKQP